MTDAPLSTIGSGLIGLALSLLMWRLTHSFVGWAVLFTPGSLLIVRGWIALLKYY